MQATEAEKKKLKKEQRIERMTKLPPAEELITPVSDVQLCSISLR